MALSKNFIRLIESMRSDSYYYAIEERRDKQEKKEDKEEKKQQKRREKFEDEGKDFKLNPFIDSLESLKNSIVAEYTDAQQRQNPASNLAGAQTAKKYLQIFNKLLERITKLKAEAIYQREKDGKFLEIEKDLALINNFRNNYKNLFDDFTRDAQNYRDEWAKESEKTIADIEYDAITNPLQDAETSFGDAKVELVKVLDTIRMAAQQPQVGGTGAASGATGAAETKYELDETIKQRKDVYSGKNGEIVKEVKKLIYEKFKKYDSVSGSKDWGIVYAKYPNVSASLRENTANVIKDIKNGLRKDNPELKDDKSGDITPAFYSVLKKYTEKTSESLSTKSGRLVSFDDFIKSRITEGFDEEAVKSGRSSSGGDSGSKSGGSKSIDSKSSSSEKPASSLPESPFKTKEQGDAFRKWVNEKHKEWAEKNKLDASGDFKNSYIRKAVKEFGEAYAKEEGESAKAMSVNLTSRDKWAKYPCVTRYSGVKETVLKDGSIAYEIGNETYYDNGRKSTPKGNANYSCDDQIFKQSKNEEKKSQGLSLQSIENLLRKGGKTTEIERDYDKGRVRGLALDGVGIQGNNIYINLYQDNTCYFEDGRDQNKKTGKWSASNGGLTIEVNDKKETGQGGWAAYYMAKSLFPNIKE